MKRTSFYRQIYPLSSLVYDYRVNLCLLAILFCMVNICYELLPYTALILKETAAVLDMADRRAMLMLNFTGSTAADSFWHGFSRQATWLPLMATAAASIVIMHPGSWREKAVLVLSIAVIILLSDQTASGIIKPAVGRLRPSHDPSIAPLLHYVGSYRGGLHGFVSSHAANTVAIVTILCSVYRDRLSRCAFVDFAAMMCYSRIYLGVHYPGDIIGGALIGWGIAYTALRLYGRQMHAFTTRRRPTTLLTVFVLTVLVLIL